MPAPIINYSGPQSILLNNGLPLYLQKGKNSFTISTYGNECPDIELIKVGKTLSDGTISDEAFIKYVNKALKMHKQNLPTRNRVISYDDNEGDYIEINEFPLRYTFFKNMHFSQGDSLKVSVNGNASHVIDVFIVAPTVESPSYGIPVRQNISVIGSWAVQKPTWTRQNRGTSYQHLAYRNTSEWRNGQHLSNMAIKLHKTGTYMIKVRCETEGDVGIINASINNSSYSNMPIAYDWVPITIDDNTNYSIVARADSAGVDPMVFVEGAGRFEPRVTGFSDDYRPSQVHQSLNLSSLDACVSQSFHLPVTGVHVNNYSTNAPESTCSIIAFSDISNIPVHLPVYDPSSANVDVILREEASVGTIAADIATDDNSVEYYTIDGMRVDNPQPGQTLIRRQGATATKVIIK